jgi:hypothetical protein
LYRAIYLLRRRHNYDEAAVERTAEHSGVLEQAMSLRPSDPLALPDRAIGRLIGFSETSHARQKRWAASGERCVTVTLSQW